MFGQEKLSKEMALCLPICFRNVLLENLAKVAPAKARKDWTRKRLDFPTATSNVRKG
jgi:hypothetical protein